MAEVAFVDSSLRDGELTPGVRFSTDQKIEIARALAAAGLAAVEVGFPGKIERDREGVPAIARAVRGVGLCVLSRAEAADVEAAARALEGADRPRVHVFAGGKPNQTEAELDRAWQAVTLARQSFDQVAFSPLDATRLKPQFLARLVDAALEGVASIINVSDTLGVGTPESIAETFAPLVAAHPGVVWSFHGHDDLGLATANSLAALAAGVRQIEGCVNGLGPRAGNTALEEVVVGVKVHGARWGVETRVDMEALRRASELVAAFSGIAVPKNKAVFGAWAKPGDLAAL